MDGFMVGSGASAEIAPGDNIGLTVTDRQRGVSLFYAPGLMEISPPVFDASDTRL